MTMYNEDIIYSIVEGYMPLKNKEFEIQANYDPPVQTPFSRWAVDEIIGELKLYSTAYPDEIIREFIKKMNKYEEVAEPERKLLYRTARTTAEDLYSYLFDKKRDNGKETFPF